MRPSSWPIVRAGTRISKDRLTFPAAGIFRGRRPSQLRRSEEFDELPVIALASKTRLRNRLNPPMRVGARAIRNWGMAVSRRWTAAKQQHGDTAAALSRCYHFWTAPVMLLEPRSTLRSAYLLRRPTTWRSRLTLQRCLQPRLERRQSTNRSASPTRLASATMTFPVAGAPKTGQKFVHERLQWRQPGPIWRARPPITAFVSLNFNVSEFWLS